MLYLRDESPMLQPLGSALIRFVCKVRKSRFVRPVNAFAGTEVMPTFARLSEVRDVAAFKAPLSRLSDTLPFIINLRWRLVDVKRGIPTI
jgi:hypothetical protein